MISFTIASNGLNMVRLAFQRSNLSVYYYVYLLLSSSLLALFAKCTILQYIRTNTKQKYFLLSNYQNIFQIYVTKPLCTTSCFFNEHLRRKIGNNIRQQTKSPFETGLMLTLLKQEQTDSLSALGKSKSGRRRGA